MGNSISTNGCNSVVVITDIKADDIGAFVLLYLWAVRMRIENFHVVVVNIHKREAATEMLKNIEFNMRKALASDHKLLECDLPVVTFTLPDGESSKTPKRHEHLYDNVVIEKRYNGEVAPTISLEDLTERLKDAKYMTHVYAPSKTLGNLIKGGNYTFVGTGYNTKGLKTADIAEWPGLHCMNNCSEYIYSTLQPKIEGQAEDKYEEGGRFDFDDIELWGAFKNILPEIDEIKQAAVVDSIGFIADQIASASEKTGIRWEGCVIAPLMREVRLSDAPADLEECSKLVKTVHIMREHPDVGRYKTYLGRIIAQLDFNGLYGPKSNGIQVELTDAQHAALWLTGDYSKETAIYDHKDGYIAYRAPVEGEKTIIAPCDVTLSDMRKTLISVLDWWKVSLNSTEMPARKKLRVDTSVTVAPSPPATV